MNNIKKDYGKLITTKRFYANILNFTPVKILSAVYKIFFDDNIPFEFLSTFLTKSLFSIKGFFPISFTSKKFHGLALIRQRLQIRKLHNRDTVPKNLYNKTRTKNHASA